MHQNKEIYKKLLKAVEHGVPAILYTLLDSKGCPDLKEGCRLLLLANNEMYGSLGLPSLDKQAISRAGNIFKQNAPCTQIVNFTMTGLKGEIYTVRLLEDLYFSQKKLIIFGGGHVAQPLAEMASILGYVTVVVDDRPEFVSPERFPRANKLICAELPNGLPENEINNLTSIVIITRGHKHDQICLKSVIRSNANYIGMIGSSRKVRQTFETLISEGFTKEELGKVSAPIGIDLGGQKPSEIALSILAEMVAREYHGSCRPLKELKAGVLA